jgi:hypothetical protein
VSDLERDYGKMSAALGRTRDERDAAVGVVEAWRAYDTRDCSADDFKNRRLQTELTAALAAYDAIGGGA